MQPSAPDEWGGPATLAGILGAELDLQALVEALIAIAAIAPAGIAIQSIDGSYRYANAALASMFGCTLDQIIGHRAGEWFAPAVSEALKQGESAAWQHAGVHDDLQQIGSTDAVVRSFRVLRKRLPGAGGGAAPLLCSIWSEAPMGRADFETQLRRELDLTRREQREFALLSIAPDDSHQVPGEGYAHRLEQRLRTSLRPMDSIFRLAPSHHVVLLSGAGLAAAHARAESLRRTCAAAQPGLRLSIGVASCPHTASERDALVDAAARALQQARQRGGDRTALAAIRLDSPK